MAKDFVRPISTITSTMKTLITGTGINVDNQGRDLTDDVQICPKAGWRPS
jgi:hypothetical protein